MTLRIGCGLLLLAGATWAQEYVISTVAGGAPPTTPAAALTVSIGAPSGVATDSAGNVYFLSLNCVFKLDKDGDATRVAGNSRAGYSGDGGPATSAQLANPTGVAVDGSGNLFIVDTNYNFVPAPNNRVRKVSTNGIIATVAGSGAPDSYNVVTIAGCLAGTWPYTQVNVSKNGRL